MDVFDNNGRFTGYGLRSGRHFIVDDENIYAMDISFDRIGPLAEVVRNLAAAAPKAIPAVVEDAEIQCMIGGKLILAKRLTKMQIRTFWRPVATFNGNVLLDAEWKDRGGAVQHTATFILPHLFQNAGAETWLLGHYSASRDTESEGNCSMYLGILCPTLKKCLLPPMSNIYPNARICMGNDWKPNFDNVLSNCAKHWAYSQQWLADSLWANDLMPHGSSSTFRILVKDDETPAEAVNVSSWPSTLSTFGNSLFGAIGTELRVSELGEEGEEDDE